MSRETRWCKRCGGRIALHDLGPKDDQGAYPLVCRVAPKEWLVTGCSECPFKTDNDRCVLAFSNGWIAPGPPPAWCPLHVRGVLVRFG